MPFAAEVVQLLNGQLFSNNETGETEVEIVSNGVPIRSTFPDANHDHVFIHDIDDINSNVRAPIMLNEIQTSIFLTDQVIHLREECNIGLGELSNAALCEIAYLRFMSYRLRLINGNLVLPDYHVRYNNAHVSNPATVNSETNLLEDVNRDVHRVMIKDWTNAHQDQVQFIANNFSNIVCTVAYVFRQKGHHYVNGADYQDTYTKIWTKVNQGNYALNPTWQSIASIGLHAIVPLVLDQFYLFSAAHGHISAPLTLRVRVPCAGTAAPFALLVGWEDAKSAYGILLQEYDDAYDRLSQLVQYCKNHRWAHGINSGYYGIPCARLDLSQFSSMAATVAGVYEAAAERATLLQSKSLQREADRSPLQKDIAQLAARALREVFVQALTKKQMGAITQD